MPKHTPFILAAVFLTLSTFTSCRKVYDYIHDHPDAHDSVCRITQLTFSTYDPNTVPQDGALHLGITYNAKGNPILLAQLNPYRPFITSEYRFRYDKFDRLTDYLYAAGGGTGYDTTLIYSPFIWHKYAYPSPNLITDTVIDYPTTLYNQPAPVAPSGSGIFLYKFDAAGKMIAIATTSKVPHPPMPVFSPIIYDARGNRDLSGYSNPNITYDSAINIYRTNKVWQLVFGDYSRNNPVYKTSLPTPTNTFGLPTRLPYNSSGDPLNIFLVYFGYYVPYYYITYACTMPKGPINY